MNEFTIVDVFYIVERSAMARWEGINIPFHPITKHRLSYEFLKKN